MTNPLVTLQSLGQSPWHDNIRRSLLTSGALEKMVQAGDITGLTSNPTIFEQAIAQSSDYSAAIAQLARQGARVQRPLWASTSTKNPAYPDVYYVEALIGPDTVNTMPPQTIVAYKDHGRPAARLEDKLEDAHQAITQLEAAGIHMDAVTQQLETEGAASSNKSFDMLMKVVKEQCTATEA
jgi:transaldolase